jgi:hypothetical protein
MSAMVDTNHICIGTSFPSANAEREPDRDPSGYQQSTIADEKSPGLSFGGGIIFFPPIVGVAGGGFCRQ